MKDREIISNSSRSTASSNTTEKETDAGLIEEVRKIFGTNEPIFKINIDFIKDSAFTYKTILNKIKEISGQPQTDNDNKDKFIKLFMYVEHLEQEAIKEAEGCELFLMSPSASGDYKKSDPNHLYLYKNDKEQICFRIEDSVFNLEIPQSIIDKKEFKFEQPEIKPDKCENLEICTTVLGMTSKAGHTQAQNQKQEIEQLKDIKDQALKGKKATEICTKPILDLKTIKSFKTALKTILTNHLSKPYKAEMGAKYFNNVGDVIENELLELDAQIKDFQTITDNFYQLYFIPTKWYELCLMSSLPTNGIPEDNKFYVTYNKKTSELQYTVLNTKGKPFEGKISKEDFKSIVRDKKTRKNIVKDLEKSDLTGLQPFLKDIIDKISKAGDISVPEFLYKTTKSVPKDKDRKKTVAKIIALQGIDNVVSLYNKMHSTLKEYGEESESYVTMSPKKHSKPVPSGKRELKNIEINLNIIKKTMNRIKEFITEELASLKSITKPIYDKHRIYPDDLPHAAKQQYDDLEEEKNDLGNFSELTQEDQAKHHHIENQMKEILKNNWVWESNDEKKQYDDLMKKINELQLKLKNLEDSFDVANKEFKNLRDALEQHDNPELILDAKLAKDRLISAVKKDNSNRERLASINKKTIEYYKKQLHPNRFLRLIINKDYHENCNIAEPKNEDKTAAHSSSSQTATYNSSTQPTTTTTTNLTYNTATQPTSRQVQDVVN